MIQKTTINSPPPRNKVTDNKEKAFFSINLQFFFLFIIYREQNITGISYRFRNKNHHTIITRRSSQKGEIKIDSQMNKHTCCIQESNTLQIWIITWFNIYTRRKNPNRNTTYPWRRVVNHSQHPAVNHQNNIAVPVSLKRARDLLSLKEITKK